MQSKENIFEQLIQDENEQLTTNPVHLSAMARILREMFTFHGVSSIFLVQAIEDAYARSRDLPLSLSKLKLPVKLD